MKLEDCLFFYLMIIFIVDIFFFSVVLIIKVVYVGWVKGMVREILKGVFKNSYVLEFCFVRLIWYGY